MTMRTIFASSWDGDIDTTGGAGSLVTHAVGRRSGSPAFGNGFSFGGTPAIATGLLGTGKCLVLSSAGATANVIFQYQSSQDTPPTTLDVFILFMLAVDAISESILKVTSSGIQAEISTDGSAKLKVVVGGTGGEVRVATWGKE